MGIETAAGSAGERLTDDEVIALEAVPGWKWAPSSGGLQAPTWAESTDRYEAWIVNHDAGPRSGSRNPQERALARWAELQRAKGVGCSEERQERLARIPGWAWRSASHVVGGTASSWRKQRFDDRLGQYREFLHAHGRPPSQEATAPAERSLGAWACTQRKRKSGVARGSTLPESQQRDLESLPGWAWTRSERVAGRMREYQAWIEEHNRMPSRRASDTLERSVATWANEVRRNRVQTTDEQRQELEATPDWTR